MNKIFSVGLCSAVIALGGVDPSFSVEGIAWERGMEPPPMNVKGEKFSSGVPVDKVFPGISFAVPYDWEAVQPDGEEIILLASKKVTALGWAVIASQSEELDWGKRLNGPMPFMHRLFNPSANSTREGAVWRNTFVDADDLNYIGWGLVVLGKGKFNLLYFLTCDSLVTIHCKQALEQLLHSTRIK